METIKKYWGYVIFPFLFLLGYIAYLRNTVNNLKQERAKAQLDERTKELLKEMQNADTKANQSQLDYDALRQHYLDQTNSSGGEES